MENHTVKTCHTTVAKKDKKHTTEQLNMYILWQIQIIQLFGAARSALVSGLLNSNA